MKYEFRAWSQKHHKMIYFNLHELLANYHDLLANHYHEGTYCDICNTDLFNIHQDIDLDDVMQSIGVKDRNGKDIFCGDILRVELSATGTVVEGRGGFVVKFDDGHRLFFEDIVSENIEVIGNAWEQPELLKAGQ